LQILLDKRTEDDCSIALHRYSRDSRVRLPGCRLILCSGGTTSLLLTCAVKNGNFAAFKSGDVMVGGAISFASTVLMPHISADAIGIYGEKAGIVCAAAMVLLLEFRRWGQLTNAVQARYLIGFGWLVDLLHMYLPRKIDMKLSFGGSYVALRILQDVRWLHLFTASTAGVYRDTPREKNNAVAGLVNFMRNIGKQRRYLRGHDPACAPCAVHQGRLVERASP